MDAKVFLGYMPPSAIVDTIVSTWPLVGDGSPELDAVRVLRLCWDALVANVGQDDAFAMVSDAIGGLMVDFMGVVA